MTGIRALKQQVAEKQLALRQAVAALEAATGEPYVAPAPALPAYLVSNCRLLESRYRLLEFLPRRARCIEIGTQAGNFAKAIMLATEPAEFHIVDLDFAPFDRVAFDAPVAAGSVVLHEGDSSTILANFPDEYFDWIYIDGDHSYTGFTKDLAVSARKVKPAGFIVCNDYTNWSPAEVFEYGVLRGINEFCVANSWEFVYLALQGQGYHDICIRRRG